MSSSTSSPAGNPTDWPPHFHARYGKHKAAIALDGTVLVGSLGTTEMKLVRQWMALHGAELAANWKLATEGKELSIISPLQ